MSFGFGKLVTADAQRNSIRVAYVVDSLARGGTQTFLVHLIRGLSRRGYHQKVYSLSGTNDFDHERGLRAADASVITIGRFLLCTGVGVLYLLVCWLVWKPNVVFTTLFFSDNIGRVLAKIARVPVIISSLRARNIHKKSWQLLLDRTTMRFAQSVVINSREIGPFAVRHEGVREDQIRYIANGVEVSISGQATLNLRSELGIGAAEKVVGSVGRLHQQKGFYYLISAFAVVRRRFENSRLLVIGSGPQLSRLTAQANELGLASAVHFLGVRADVSRALASLDVYVQASLFEGMSNATMEAMAAGLPVVATSVEGTRELIENAETGWLVAPANEQALADGICLVLADPTTAWKVGRAASFRVASEFSVGRMVDAYDCHFRKLLQRQAISSRLGDEV